MCYILANVPARTLFIFSSLRSNKIPRFFILAGDYRYLNNTYIGEITKRGKNKQRELNDLIFDGKEYKVPMDITNMPNPTEWDTAICVGVIL